MKRPLGERILVRRNVAADQSPGGLFIPELAKEKLNSGVVLAVGAQVDIDEVDAGDEVEFSQFAGVKVRIPDYAADGKPEELIILTEKEILLVDDKM